MDFIESLGREHRTIDAVLAALERLAGKLERGDAVDSHPFLRILTFLRGFADGYHHEREELVLLKGLAAVEYASSSGVLEFVREEHRKERGLLARLEAAVAMATSWSADTKRAIADAARALAVFEREHMARESELLFPSAERTFAAKGTADLERRLERYDRERAASWTVSWLQKLGEEIIAEAANEAC